MVCTALFQHKFLEARDLGQLRNSKNSHLGLPGGSLCDPPRLGCFLAYLMPLFLFSSTRYVVRHHKRG